MSRKILLTVLTLVFVGLLGGCIWQYSTEKKRTAAATETCTKQLFAMDTYMSFTANGQNSEAAVDAAMEEVKRLDALLSTGSTSSEVSKINEVGSGVMSEDTAKILAEAEKIYASTDGMFDFTIYPLMCLWGFPTQEYHVPTEAELQEVLPLIDASEVQTDGSTVTLGEGQKIDFGGIAKGYTSGKIMELFQKQGIVSGMVSLGGNVQTLNTKPDGSKWKIGIQDPQGSQGTTLAVVSVDNKAVVTSGGYERYFEENGNTYIHILNPKTGYPAENDLISVSVVSQDGMLADALSTSLYLMGLENATAYWQGRKEEFDLILITKDRKIYITSGIQNEFQTEEEVHVIA